jgi:two-component sensor histidine kinase
MPDHSTTTADDSRALVRRLQQQKAALAAFGLEAFRADDLDALLTKAAALAGEGLGVKRAKVLELLPPGDRLLVRAGVGWEPDVVGNATIDADHASPAGYALLTGEPVASADLEKDARFRCPEVLRRHGIRSAVNVIIRGDDGPFGVLEVDSRQARRFTADDANFLQGFANLLAAAIDRLRTHRRLAEAARQKEVLLHELQHRVKNSLQVIAGFVNLQRRKAAHPQARDGLDVVAGRIEALRVMYGKLYLVDHRGEVDFGAYLEELCGGLLGFQPAERGPVRLDLGCAPLRVDLDRAVPLGLLTSEFVVNSLKHAFSGGRGGTLTVRLEAADGGRQARLVLADDGPGLPAAAPAGERGSGLVVRRRHLVPSAQGHSLTAARRPGLRTGYLPSASDH